MWPTKPWSKLTTTGAKALTKIAVVAGSILADLIWIDNYSFKIIY